MPLRQLDGEDSYGFTTLAANPAGSEPGQTAQAQTSFNDTAGGGDSSRF